MSELLSNILNAGFPLDQRDIIHLFVGGSQLHGAKVHGYDDLDIYGCYIEPPTHILGLRDLSHFVWSSGSQERKNTSEDVDVTMYSLHRWGELIMKGNPAIVHFLYAANEAEASVWNTRVLPHRDEFLSKKSAVQ